MAAHLPSALPAPLTATGAATVVAPLPSSAASPVSAPSTSTSPAADSPGPPGWHGKLPALGDFVSRRLSTDFIEPWDAWLSKGLHDLRSAAPAHWLQHYLHSPSWRFLLQPGALPGGGAGSRQAWAGVLMPSVDRVGRYFPFTLAQPLGEAPLQTHQLQALWRGLTAWDDLARDALHDDWTAEQLEAALQQHHAGHGSLGGRADAATPAHANTSQSHPAAGAAMAGELPRHPGQALAVPGAGDAAAAMQAQLQPQAWRLTQGCSWWQAVPDEGPARLWLVCGLPASLGLLFAGPDAP